MVGCSRDRKIADSGPGHRALGLDLGGQYLKWALLDGDEIADHGRVPTPREGEGAVLDLMASVAGKIGDLDAIGVGVPGLFDRVGRTTLIPNIAGDWKGFALAPLLSERVGVLVTLANDARSFTLAELRLGAGRGLSDIACLTLGTGIGGGATVRGRVHLGQGDRAGEFGHVVVNPDGPLCGCGNNGCVETYAGARAVVAAAARAVFQGVETSLREACGGDAGALSPEIVAAEARRGDRYAQDVMRHAGEALGFALAGVCIVLAPELIVIGGGMAGALDVLQPVIERTLWARAPLAEKCAIVPSGLGVLAGPVGAALWTREPV